MYWLLLLPLTVACVLTFGFFVLAFALVRLAIKLIVALALLPFVLVVGLVGLLAGVVALSFALLIPLLPVLFLAFCAWAVVKLVAKLVVRPVTSLG